MADQVHRKRTERKAERIRADTRDYDALYAAWKAEGCGYRRAAQCAKISPKRARRIWERGVAGAGLPAIRDIVQGRAKLPSSHAAALEAPAEAQKAVTAVVQSAAQTAAADVATDIARAMHEMTQAQKRLYMQGAKALEEEAALVDNARRTALTMLGRLIAIVKASGPMMDVLAARLSADAADMTVPQGFAYMGKLLSTSQQIVGLGQTAITLRRRLLGEAEAVIGINHGGVVEMSREDAARELEMVQALLEQANNEGSLRVIEGGSAAG